MKYADNQPTNECKNCIERIEHEKCRGCEGRTLNHFIAASVFIYGFLILTIIALLKGWLK